MSEHDERPERQQTEEATEDDLPSLNPGGDAAASLDNPTGEAEGVATGAPSGVSSMATGAAGDALDDAVGDIPAQARDGISTTAGAAEDMLSTAASGGSGAAVLDQGVGAATGAGTNALSAGLERAGVPGAAVIAQSLGQAAQIGQSAVRQVAQRRRSEEASGGAASADQAAGASAPSPAGGDGHGEQVRVLFESEPQDEVAWDVARLELVEALNRPYEAKLELRTDQLDAEPSALLGANATVLIERGANQQRFPGIVVRVEEGTATGDSLSVHVTLAPAVKLLEQRRDTRVFQLMTATEILQAVLGGPLGELEREVSFELERQTYPAREYCTQFDETDLDFAHRLMEEEGLAYRFDTEDGHEAMIVFDRSQSAESILSLDDGAVPMTDYGSSDGGHELVTSFRLASEMTPTALSMRYFDWTRTPRTTSPAAEPEDPVPLEPSEEPEDTTREEYDHDTRPLTLTEYDEEAGTFGGSDVEDQARLRRELQVRDARVGRGCSTATGMRPGLSFTLENHRMAGLDGRYYLTRVKHTYLVAGTESDEAYTNEFQCIPLDIPFRPERRTPRPRVPGIQTATVVGPSGQEIHTDKHGRVRVQFHWDRLGERNDGSSCWVRVQQPWAGAGWGFVFIPRVGMEVTVTFVNGDPDQPLVTGSVYNGINHPPLDLDDQKTRSTIKTRSSSDSEGYNELTFEDLADEEQIILHAQKDLNETIENAHSTTVHGGQTNSVDGDQGETVGGDATVSVTGTRNKTITGDETNTLEAARTTTVTGLEKLTCRDAREVRVGQTELHQVTGQLTETFDGGRRTTIAQGDESTVSSGNSLRTVSAGQYLVTSAAQIKLTQGETNFLRLDGLAKLGTTGVVTVTNDATMVEGDTGGTLTLTADSEIKLVCGSGSISIKTDGTIEISGTTVEVKSGANAVRVEAGGVTTSGSAVRVSGNGSVDISGPTVKVN